MILIIVVRSIVLVIKRDNNMITVFSDLLLLDWSVSGDKFQKLYNNSTWHSKLKILAVSDIIGYGLVTD